MRIGSLAFVCRLERSIVRKGNSQHVRDSPVAIYVYNNLSAKRFSFSQKKKTNKQRRSGLIFCQQTAKKKNVFAIGGTL